MDRRLRMGMVGGGPGSFIGQIHRMAARLDGRIELTAGCFSTSKEKNRAAAKAEFLAPDRVYDDYRQMFERERQLPEEKRIDFAAIVTPNDTHFPIAMASAGPVCPRGGRQDDDADREMQKTAAPGERPVFVVSQQNKKRLPMSRGAATGHGMERWAKSASSGRYQQGWLADPVTAPTNRGLWRTDSAQTGVAAAWRHRIHAENLALL